MRSVTLQRLLESVSKFELSGPPAGEIVALEHDSRRVGRGAMFVALRGFQVDGHHFIADAVRAGACAVVSEQPVALPAGVSGVVVPDSTIALSQLSAAFYGHPSRTMCVVGITGTNGKTTTAHLIRAILDRGGIACGVMGTLGASFGGREWALANTTPLAPQLHAILAEMKEAGARGVALEVSSHALALHRVDDVRFSIGVLTNISPEHLDFHSSLADYANAKRRLFEFAAGRVFNTNDAFGARWALEFPGANTLTYAFDDGADVTPAELVMSPAGSSFRIGKQEFAVPLAGRFNVANALAAVAASRLAGIEDAVAASALRAVDPVPGRMQRIVANGVTAIVDYAHTPDALANVLRAAREATPGRLLIVFGCGGDRDRAKRPVMGKLAAELADIAIVTSDNPRSEDPAEIARQVTAGVDSRKHSVILDRREAIHAAIAQARPGDTVVVAGKGHERVQLVGNSRLPFDDLAEVEHALELRVPA